MDSGHRLWKFQDLWDWGQTDPEPEHSPQLCEQADLGLDLVLKVTHIRRATQPHR